MRKIWVSFWHQNLRNFEKNLKQSDPAPLKERNYKSSMRQNVCIFVKCLKSTLKSSSQFTCKYLHWEKIIANITGHDSHFNIFHIYDKILSLLISSIAMWHLQESTYNCILNTRILNSTYSWAFLHKVAWLG